jgi:hypothetical protein
MHGKNLQGRITRLPTNTRLPTTPTAAKHSSQVAARWRGPATIAAQTIPMTRPIKMLMTAPPRFILCSLLAPATR